MKLVVVIVMILVAGCMIDYPILQKVGAYIAIWFCSLLRITHTNIYISKIL